MSGKSSGGGVRNAPPPKTFETFDRLGLENFAAAFTKFLANEHQWTEDALVVSLDAPFGSGKTTFVEMWTEYLRKRGEAGEGAPIPIVINAWESDFCGDPFLSIISAFTRALAAFPRAFPDAESQGRFKEAAKDVGWFAVGMANSFVSHLFGVDPVAASELAEQKKAGRRPPKPDILEAYLKRTDALERLRGALTDCFGNGGLKAIVMVDELDRCRPTFAVEYLEAIKHVFNVHGIAFVLAVDKAQMRSSVRVLFGDLNFEEYFRKFVKRQVQLPRAKEENWKGLIQYYYHKFIQSAGEGSPARRTAGYQLDRFLDVLPSRESLDLTPRQLEEVFRIAGHVSAAEGKQLHWGYSAAIILMAALSVKRPDEYRAIGGGKLNAGELVQIIAGVVHNTRDRAWWCSIFLSGYPLSNVSQTDLGSVLVEKQIIPSPTNMNIAMQEFFKGVAQAWGYDTGGSGIPLIYEHIEGLKPFFET